MNEWQTMLAAVAAVFGVIGAGAAARGLDWLSEEADETLIRLTIRLLFPAFIIHTMASNERLFSSGSLIVPPIVGFVLPLLGFAVAGVVVKFFGTALGLTTPAERRTFVVSVGLFNYGYIPVPLSRQIFSDDAQTLSSLFLHNVGVEIAIWTVAIVIFAGKLKGRWIAGIFNPIVLSIFAAMALNYSGLWKIRPLWLSDFVSMLGNSAIPMALLLSGAMIYDVWKDARFSSAGKSLLAASIIRLGILPAMFVALAWLLPVSLGLKRVLIVQAAMPSAIFPIVMAKHYGGDPPTAVRIVIVTSLLGLGTIPLWLLVGLKML